MTYETSHLRLGRLPSERPVGLPNLSHYKGSRFPAAPATFGALAPYQSIDLGMDGNDRLGDCVEAGTDHLIAIWNEAFGGAVTRPTLPQIESQYATESPGDQGIVEATHLELWQTEGIWGNKIDWALPTGLDESDYRDVAAFLGGGMLGIACPNSAQQQFAEQSDTGQMVPWTVVPGARVEGGHCIISLPVYVASGIYCVTWGGIVLVTWKFLRRYGEEHWAIGSSQLKAKGVNSLGLPYDTITADAHSLRAA